MARWDPSHVLAEVESKRQIVKRHGSGNDPCDEHDAWLQSIPCETLMFLTWPYRDRPGYDPAWHSEV